MMDCYSFGRRLIESGDLDPVYTLLWNADWPPALMKRWLLAYWCFYHVGTACWISQEPGHLSYWRRMKMAAASKNYPRGSERRHFRAENARKSVLWLEKNDIWGEFDRACHENRSLTAQDVMDYVQEWVGFGPWIAFKVADMLERLGIIKVSFLSEDLQIFDSPRAGAAMLWELEHPSANQLHTPQDASSWAIGRILEEIGDLKAPPRFERKINIQEAETVLCKWKSYRNGRYKIGEDIQACRQGLLRFSLCRLSQDLIRAGRKGGLWSL